MNPCKHGCISNTIYVNHKSNKHVFKYNEHENQYMLTINNKKACK